MNPITATRHASAPPGRVWEVATDVGRWEGVLRGVDSVEMVSPPGAFGVGTRWRETRTIGGRRATEEMWVTQLDPPRSYTVEADSHGAHYSSTLTLVPTAGGTELTLSFRAEAHGTLRRLLAPAAARVMARPMARQLGHDLDDLGRAAEQGGVPG